MHHRRARSSRSSLPSPGWVRVALLLALGGLVTLVAWRYPLVPDEAWPSPHRFEPTSGQCREQREARQWTSYRMPDEAGLATVADVADKLDVEPSWICRANGWDAACGLRRVNSEEVLLLPLHADGIEAARRAGPPKGRR